MLNLSETQKEWLEKAGIDVSEFLANLISVKPQQSFVEKQWTSGDLIVYQHAEGWIAVFARRSAGNRRGMHTRDALLANGCWSPGNYTAQFVP